MSLQKKNVENIDTDRSSEYLLSKMKLIADLKDKALFLANEYGQNIKIEIDVNPRVSSVRMSVKEYL